MKKINYKLLRYILMFGMLAGAVILSCFDKPGWGWLMFFFFLCIYNEF